MSIQDPSNANCTIPPKKGLFFAFFCADEEMDSADKGKISAERDAQKFCKT